MYIDILILSQLMNGPKHGYEIKKNVLFMLGKSNSINNNYLYPALKRFEEKGAITKSLETQEGRPNRHMYSLTDLGQTMFYDMLNDFPPEYAANNNEIFNRLAFFELLEVETRKKFVDSRIAHLQEQIQSLDNLNQIKADTDFLPFSPYIYNYSMLLASTELDFFLQLQGALKQTQE
ncbi:PadR family transcriptional regulator [Paenibacillus tepidiphilus]|uniref:PadR family transcriptional regulator n=1 Tax=Paenibacillus tepidiphilus TaxID=2608683 RepID=UPI001239CF2B|nr:PadR family transcriptional regulator [Paenibacillus tepidiphilus]